MAEINRVVLDTTKEDLDLTNKFSETGLTAQEIADSIKKVHSINSSASEIDGSVSNKIPSNILDSSLLTKAKANTWIRKHFSSTKNLVDSYWAYIPIGNGYYSTFALGMFSIAPNTTRHLGRMMLGLIGTYTHHSSAVKIGTFTTSSFDYTVGGNQVYSTTAGDIITFSISGHTAVARLSLITNGGYIIVSVDGDWTLANRLPLFTNADFTAGKCRVTDVGKRYLETGSVGDNVPDVHIPIFDNLLDTSHTIVFETTGTKNTTSSGTRSYIGGVVGCSSSDIGATLNGTTKIIAHVEIVQDFGTHGSSAMIYTPEIEKTVANTWEFLGEVHSSETDIEWKIEVDGVDQTSIIAGSYIQGAVIKFNKITTIATTDAVTTPVCKKKQNIVFSAYQNINCTVDWSVEWLEDKRVRSSYGLMLPLGRLQIGQNAKIQDRWTQVDFGNYKSIPSDLNGNDNAMHGFEEAMYTVVSSDKHNVKAYATMLDYGKSVNYFAQSCPSFVTVHDRADFYDKVYFFRSTQQNIEVFKIGDKIGGFVGFGLKI